MEELEHETVEVQRPRLIYSERQGWPGYYLHTEDNPIATDSPDQWQRMGKVAVEIAAARLPKSSTVAVIGGGFYILPRLLSLRPWWGLDVYEIEPVVVRRAPEGAWNNVLGDWRTTLTGTYDVIVYDIGDEPDRALLESHLQPGGILLGVG